MITHEQNHALCENMNKIQLRILTSGYAILDHENDWKGLVTNPTFSRLYYILNGEFYIISRDGTEITLSAGNCYLLPAGYSFEFGCNETMEQVYFHVKLCDFDEIDMLKNCIVPISYEFPQKKVQDYMAMVASQNLMGSLKARCEVYTSLVTLLEKHHITLEKNEYSPQVCRAIKYIESNLSLQLKISEIADNAFTATSTLTRNFKQETGMTIGQYIDESIMFQAEQMLLSGKASILEISERFGFCDQFYFARRFKEKYEMSPREYRKSTLM